MIDYESSAKIVESLEQSEHKERDFLELRRELFLACTNYARIRTDWSLLSRDQRKHSDTSRTTAHNRVIGSCNALSRYMSKHGLGNSWRETLGTDRKVIGDFACYVHAYLGVTAR